MRFPRLFLVFLAVPLSAATSGPLVPELMTPARSHERVEFRVRGGPVTDNNFDPDVVQIDATITAPSGRVFRVPAFWYQAFERELRAGVEVLTPRGEPEWRVRYTPSEPGAHTITVQAAGGPSGAANPVVFAVEAAPRVPSARWVRVAAGRRWLETDDGRPLRLIGANVCWAGARGTYDFDDWFAGMHQAGENFARLWLSPWSIGLEHKPGTLTRYDLGGAWQLDHVFRVAEERGLYLLLCLDHHGMFQVNNRNWGGTNNFWRTNNPYSAELGGPCAAPNDFFAHPQARTLYQKRLRYLIARYGYSPNLLAWQFFNEIDNVFGPGLLDGADVVAWHREMGAWLKQQDPFGHLVTTSLTGGVDRPEVWSLPEMDFSVYHSYNEPGPAGFVAATADSMVRRYGKPVMIGEFGTDFRAWTIAADPYLRGFRQGLWGGALGGSVGVSMSWWWEDLHRHDVYPLYRVAADLLRRGGWPAGEWSPLTIASPGPAPVLLGAAESNGEVFDAAVALSQFRRLSLRNEAAIGSPLAAARASELLSGFLHGTRNAAQARPLRLTAWFAEQARLVFHVNAVAASATLRVAVDGQAALREVLADTDGQAQPNGEINRELVVSLPAGLHTIEISHDGPDWVLIDQLRLERVRPAAFGGGWDHPAQAVGLTSGEVALVYVVSPRAVWPAGALQWRLPEQAVHLEVTGLAAGTYRAEWFDPETGHSVGTASVTADAGGRMRLVVPAIRVDAVGIVRRAE